MHPTVPTRRSRLSPLLRAALAMAAAGCLGACDRHSADEVPENYGHGSSHSPNYNDHRIDSGKDPQGQDHHFSDTEGLRTNEEGKGQSSPAASPTATPANRLF